VPGIDPTWIGSSPPIEEQPLPTPESAPRSHNPFLSTLKTSAVFLASAAAVYLVIVGPSLAIKGWYVITHFNSRKQPTQVINTAAETNSISGAAISAALDALPPPPQVETTSSKPDQPSSSTTSTKKVAAKLASSSLGLSDNLLVIPKLNIHVPVIWNSSGDEAIMLENLSKGVAHYGFTSLPNEQNGNVFITGHSSYYWWDKGKYKTVFATISELVPGDQLFVQYQGKIFVYEMVNKVTVKPSDVSVTDPTDTPTLSLMTCVPVGTALNRLVVRSKLLRVYSAEVQESSSPIVPTVEAAELPKTTAIPVTPTVPSPASNPNPIEALPGL
jgi:LPXTG-site transpeptidase (sortase) family protein